MTQARPLICSLFLALPLTFGCVAEWHADDDFDTDRPSSRDDSCVCDDDPPANNDNDPPEGCPSAEGTIYVGTDAAVCTTIGFTCPDTHTSFNSDACGCGCEPIPMEEPVCPSEDGEGITRVSRDLKVCSTIQFTCPEGSDPFNGTCGCGCIAQTSTTPTCPDPTDPNVHYIGEDGSAVCEMIDFTCPEGCVEFNDECGCGCIENP